MKSVRYFTLNFSGFTTAACEKQGYLRLIAGDHVFYTDKRYFNDPSLFDRLTINQPLHLAPVAIARADDAGFREVDGEGLSSALVRGGRRKKQRHPKVALS